MTTLHIILCRWFGCCNSSACQISKIQRQVRVFLHRTRERKKIELEIFKREMGLIESEEEKRLHRWNNIMYEINDGMQKITKSAEDVNISLQSLEEILEERNNLLSLKNCSVCFSKTKDVICYPCKHIATCRKCQKKIKDSKCVICRQDVTSYTKVFF